MQTRRSLLTALSLIGAPASATAAAAPVLKPARKAEPIKGRRELTGRTTASSRRTARKEQSRRRQSPHRNEAFRDMFHERQTEALDGLMELYADNDRHDRNLAVDLDVMTELGHEWCAYLSDYGDDDWFLDVDQPGQSIMACDCVEDTTGTDASVITVECVQQQDRCYEPFYVNRPSDWSMVGAHTFRWQLAVDQTDIRIVTCFSYADDPVNPQEVAGKEVCTDDPYNVEGTCTMSIDDQNCQSCTYCETNDSYLSADCRSIAPNGDDSSAYAMNQCSFLSSNTPNPDEAARRTVFRHMQSNMQRCRTDAENRCAAGVRSFDDTHGPDLNPMEAEMGAVLNSRNFTEYCAAYPWGQGCIVDWPGVLSTTSLMQNYENACTRASGIFLHASFEVDCRSYTQPGVPTYYQASTGRPFCLHEDGCLHTALEGLRETVRDYTDDLISSNGDDIGVCHFVVDITDPSMGTTPQNIIQQSALEGIPKLDTYSACLLVEDQIKSFEEPSYTAYNDDFLPHSPDAEFSCQCQDAVPPTDDLASGILEVYSAACKHKDPLCVKSTAIQTTTKIRAFAGTDSYDIQTGLAYSATRNEYFLSALSTTQCFQYAGAFDNRNVCFTGRYTGSGGVGDDRNTCSVAVGTQTCRSCRFCNPNDFSDFSIYVDCTNVLPTQPIIDECTDPSNPTPLGRTYLQFLATDLAFTDETECERLFGSVPTTPTGPVPTPPTGPSSPTSPSPPSGPSQPSSPTTPVGAPQADPGDGGSIATGRPTATRTECFRNPAATVDKCEELLQITSVSSTDCSCYNFCDDFLLGCAGAPASEQVNGGACSGEMIIGCSFFFVEEERRNEETEMPTKMPANLPTSPTGATASDDGSGNDRGDSNDNDNGTGSADRGIGSAARTVQYMLTVVSIVVTTFVGTFIL